MKLMSVPSGRPAIVSLACARCGQRIQGMEPAVADIDAWNVDYYHAACTPLPPRLEPVATSR